MVIRSQGARFQEKLADFKPQEAGIRWQAEMRSVSGEPIAERDDRDPTTSFLAPSNLRDQAQG